jgi:hypothetical protein
VDEAKKTATDLSGLVRKKNKDESAAGSDTESNGKRKAEESVEDTEAKKAKVDA